ncbi:MAG: AI-2E family transporter [Cyanobacteria bacterium SZAS TMP-1]|nr:AI-2E family transporter [Cyanobacteria bacterium SZAS TMP-1]
MLKWFIAALAVWLAYLVREQFPPFIVGMVIAYLLSHPVHVLNKHLRVHRGLAVLLVYATVATTVGVAVWKGFPALTEQATSLFQQREAIVASLAGQITSLTGWSPDIDAITRLVLEKVQTFIATKPEELLAFSGVITSSLLFTAIALISSIYFLYDAQKFGRYALRFVPQDKRQDCVTMVKEINRKFSRYLSGQLLLIGIMSVLAFTILRFYGIKYALVVALIAGLMEIVPVFGPICALALALTIAASQLGLNGTAPVAILFLCVRVLQDYIVSPRVIGQAVQLHPLVIFVFVLGGQTVAGGLGMLVAVPTAAALKVILDHFYPPSSQDPGESGEGPDDKGRHSLWAQLLALAEDLKERAGKLRDRLKH